MKIIINIDDSLKGAITDYLKYQSQVLGGTMEMIDNPETQDAFLVRKGKEYYQNCYEAGRVNADKLDRDNRLSDLQSEKNKITAI